MNSYAEFKRMVGIKLRISLIALVIALGVMVYILMKRGDQQPTVYFWANAFRLPGVIGGVVGFIASRVLRLLAQNNHEEIAKKEFTRRNDERVIYVQRRTDAFTLNVIIWVLLAAIIGTAYFYPLATGTLAAGMVVLLAIWGFVYLYFNRKY